MHFTCGPTVTLPALAGMCAAEGTLVSLIRVGNAASRRVAEKVGMHCAAEIMRYGRRYWKYVLERDPTASGVRRDTMECES